MSENKVISKDEQWLDSVIPKIAKNIGSYEKGTFYVLDKIKYRVMSNLYFVQMWSTNKINQLREVRFLVIKRGNREHSNVVDVESQFCNEIMFYRMFSQPNENFAKCFYHDISLNEYDSWIIALEDVSKNEFRICPVSFDAPYNYIVATLRELGRFHAKGYVLKETNRARFYDIVNNIKDNRYIQKNKEGFGKVVNLMSIWVVEYLRENGHDMNFCDKMEALLSNAFEKVMMRVSTVTELSESLSTICHGDITLDNVLFQSQSDGHFNAMLIDFGMLRYGTPVIDLSTFLCVCCTNDMVRNKLYDMLTIYHKSLINYISQEGVVDLEKYSYNAILNNYKEGCLFGFVIASFYLVYVMGYIDIITTKDLNVEDIVKIIKTYGGKKISAILAKMLLQMVELGCLEHFL